jgi:hypothetical protein
VKRLLTILAVCALVSGGLARAATEPAAIAAIYFNDTRINQIGTYLHGNAAECVAKGSLSNEQAREIDGSIDRYLAESKKIVPEMQADFAAAIPQLLSAKEMVDLGDFFNSSAGRAFMDAITKPTRIVAASQMRFCVAQTQLAFDPNNIVQDAIAALPTLDRDALREFASTPSAKKISSINEAVGETNAKYKNKFELAATAAGLTRWIVK